MSLIYQSLQKLQSREQTGSTPRSGESGGSPGRRSRLRGVLWALLGIVLLAGGGYTVWSLGEAQPQKEAPPSAVSQNEDNTTKRSLPAQETNASRIAISEESAPRSGKAVDKASRTTGGNRNLTSAGTPYSRLLHISCRRNGTRARLSLEFNRLPKDLKTIWREGRQTLHLTFAGATSENPEQLPQQAARAGLDLSLESAAPLRLRLKAPDLEEHNAFTLPESPRYGPRYVLALRFNFEKKGHNDPEGQGEKSATKEPDPEQVRSGQTKSRAAEQNDSHKPGAGDRGAASLEVATNPGEQKKSAQGDLLERASDLLEKGQSDRAAHLLRKRLRLRPRNTRTRLLLSRALREAGSPEQAGSVLRQGIRMDPEAVLLRIRYARSLISDGRYRPALKALQLDNPPDVQDHVPYYALAAYARRKLGHNERAARLYRTLAENEPDKGRWWMGLGLCLERLNLAEAARTAYERALASSGLREDIRSFVHKRKQGLARMQGE